MQKLKVFEERRKEGGKRLRWGLGRIRREIEGKRVDSGGLGDDNSVSGCVNGDTWEQGYLGSSEVGTRLKELADPGALACQPITQ